jgi:hypothetical protein
MKKLCAVMMILSGCSSMYPGAWQQAGHGRFKLEADAEGLRAYGDTLNALVTNAKEAPGVKSAAWGFRDNQEASLTDRVKAKIQSLMQKN